MKFGTILVHFNDPARAATLADAATGLAVQHEAHLIGLHVLPRFDVHMAIRLPHEYDLENMYASNLKKESGDIHDALERSAARAGVSFEWRTVEAVGDPVAEVVMNHGRCADILVTCQEDPETIVHGMKNVPEDVMFGCGRPVLFVPFAGKYADFAKQPTIAWDGSRESARAVWDALPFLVRADEVRLITVNTEKTELRGAQLPGTELAAVLARHGVNCQVSQSVAKDLSVADEILSRTADFGSDLLVMGGFGHSRIREYVLGGVTREILKHMTLPVLMSH